MHRTAGHWPFMARLLNAKWKVVRGNWRQRECAQLTVIWTRYLENALHLWKLLCIHFFIFIFNAVLQISFSWISRCPAEIFNMPLQPFVQLVTSAVRIDWTEKWLHLQVYSMIMPDCIKQTLRIYWLYFSHCLQLVYFSGWIESN